MSFDDDYGALKKTPPYAMVSSADKRYAHLRSPASDRTGLRGMKDSFYGMRKAPPFGMPHALSAQERVLYSARSDRSGLRGMKASYYGGDIEVEVSPQRIYYKGDTMSALALSVVTAALIKYMR